MKILFQALEFINNMRCGVCSTPLVEGSYAFRKMSQFRSKPNWILIDLIRTLGMNRSIPVYI